MTLEYERYFRDVYDHLIRVSDLVDSYRDLLSGALDTHLSTVSNRLNVVMKQLTIIATVFLPLSFLTGFFGQNFGWMIGRITSFSAFWAVGVGSQIVVAAGPAGHVPAPRLALVRRDRARRRTGQADAADDDAHALAGPAPHQVHGGPARTGPHQPGPGQPGRLRPRTGKTAVTKRVRPHGPAGGVKTGPVRAECCRACAPPGSLVWSAKPRGTARSSDGSRPGR